MDNSPNAFKSYIQSAFVPIVVVLCTAGVEKICQKQGIKFVDAFKNATLEKRRLPIRFGEFNYDLQDFKLRFVELKDLEKQDDAKLSAYLANQVDDVAADSYSDFKLREKADVSYFLKTLTMPWYEKYKQQFVLHSSTVEHEFFHHPIACIIAASSEDQNPIAALVKLFDPTSPPSIFAESYVDATIPRSYIYIYTNDVPRETADKRLGEIKNTFPSTTSALLRAEALFESGAPPMNTSRVIAETNVSVMVSEMMAKSIAPFLEKQMAELNEIIITSKKGIFFSFRRRFGGKGESDANANSNAGELATRKLADILFFLQDYENASIQYKNCTKDFNNEKTWNYYAATQEMIGVCLFLLGRDTEQFLENAYVYYQKSSQFRCAVRASFFNGDIMKSRGNAKGAADVFIRAAEKDCDMFCSALFQEQAAFCHLMTMPLLFRKFCFRMVMAATRFQECGKRKHARRCYEMAYNVYEGRNWGAVEDQLHQAFIRIAFSLGKVDEAVSFAQRLLVKNSLPFQKQNSIVREFLYICKENFKSNDPMPIVPLPIVSNETIKVHLHDYSDTDSTDWEVLEAAFRIESDTQKINQRQGFDLWKMKEEEDLVNKERVVVAEEYVTVEVEVKNPLQVPLQFTHVHLVGTYTESPSSNPSNPNPKPPTNTFQFSFNEFVASYTRAPNAIPHPSHPSLPFRVEPFDILLGPSDSKKLTFAVQPLKAGQLELKGLGLYMCGSVWGRREFNLKPRRLNRTPQQRKGVFHEPNRCLTFKVTDPMPRLEVSCVNFPDTLYRGELRQAGLRLRNCSSKMGLKNVRVRCSHPNAVLFVGSNNNAKRNRSGESVPLDVSLAPGAEVTVPVWLHFSTPTNAVMRFLFYYESEVGNNDLKYRLTRCSASIAVKPALVLKSATHPAPSDLDAYLLHLELSNIDNLHTFTFQQITSISTQWRIESLSFGNDANIPQDIFTLKPGQSSNTFFRIKRIPASSAPTPAPPASPAPAPQQSNICVTNPSRKPVSALTFPFYDFLEKDKHPENVEAAGGKLGSSSGMSALLGLSSSSGVRATQEDDPNKVDILLFWESGPSIGGGARVYGQLSIPQISFVPAQTTPSSSVDTLLLANTRRSVRSTSGGVSTIPAPTPSTSLRHLLPDLHNKPVAVRFLIECPAHIVHDFNSHGLCVVPLQLHVANCSNNAPITFELLTLSPDEGAEEIGPEGGGGEKKASQYLWSGTTSYFVDNLAPQGKTELALTACFFKPGVYNLTRFKLTVQGTNNITTTIIHAPFQHLITIEDQQST